MLYELSEESKNQKKKSAARNEEKQRFTNRIEAKKRKQSSVIVDAIFYVRCMFDCSHPSCSLNGVRSLYILNACISGFEMLNTT